MPGDRRDRTDMRSTVPQSGTCSRGKPVPSWRGPRCGARHGDEAVCEIELWQSGGRDRKLFHLCARCLHEAQGDHTPNAIDRTNPSGDITFRDGDTRIARIVADESKAFPELVLDCSLDGGWIASGGNLHPCVE